MIRAIVTDIEGTTSDIRFVHNVLFPYARGTSGRFCDRSQQFGEPVKTILDNLRPEIAPAGGWNSLLLPCSRLWMKTAVHRPQALRGLSGAKATSAATSPAISIRTFAGTGKCEVTGY